MNQAKTSTQRGKERLARLAAKGLKQVRNVWAYPEDHAAIKAFAAAKVKAAEKTRRATPTDKHAGEKAA